MADTFDYNEYKKRTRQAESSGNDKEVSLAGASGRYQFLKSTWEGLGYKWKDRFNPQLQEEAMRKFTMQNVNYFRKRYGRDPDFTDVYGMHHLGAGGYSNVLDNADQLITDYYSEDTINKNPHFKKFQRVGELKGFMASKMYGKQAVPQYSERPKEEVTVENPFGNYYDTVPTFDYTPNTGQLSSVPISEKTTEEKSDSAKINIIQDQLNTMMGVMQQQQNPQQQLTQTPHQQPEPTFSYLADTSLFTLPETQVMQDGGRIKSQYEPTRQKSLIKDNYYNNPSLREPIKEGLSYLVGTGQYKDGRNYSFQGTSFKVTRGKDEKGEYYSVYQPNYYDDDSLFRRAEYYDRFYSKDLKPVQIGDGDISKMKIYGSDSIIKNTTERTDSEKEKLKEWLVSPIAVEMAKKRGVDVENRVRNVDKVPYIISDEAFTNPFLKNAQGAYEVDRHRVLLKQNTASPTAYHEFNHASTEGDYGISEKDRQDIIRRLRPDVTQYIGDPSEIQARLNVFRRELEQRGVYDPKNEVFSRDVLEDYKKKAKVGDGTIRPWSENVEELLRSVKTDEDLIWLMNNIVQNDIKDTVTYAQDGGRTPIKK